MSFLLALIFYNASLQINIVPQCKDWSISCFDLADFPVKLESPQKFALKMMGSSSPLFTVDHLLKGQVIHGSLHIDSLIY